jgi:hypothetical protein
MDAIIQHLEQSIDDELFSKSERKSLRALIDQHPIGPDQINFLRSKVYELAHQKISDANYKFIVDWIRDANSALTQKTNGSPSISDAYFSPENPVAEPSSTRSTAPYAR